MKARVKTFGALIVAHSRGGIGEIIIPLMFAKKNVARLCLSECRTTGVLLPGVALPP